MQHHVRRRLGLYWLIPAALFLADPNIAFYDWLPDCIGYLLMLWGLSQVRDLSDRISDACARVQKMLTVSTCLLLVRIYLHYILPMGEEGMNASENPMLLLLGSFVALFFQCYYLLPIFRELLLSMESLAEREGSCALPIRRGKSAGERLLARTRVFVVANAILALLPEVTAIFGVDYAGGKTAVDWSRFVDLFRTFAAFFSLILSVVWLVSYLVFWIRILRDRALCERLEARYAREILPLTRRLDLRRLQLSFCILILASIFLIDLRVEGMDLLPVFLLPVLALVGLYLGGTYCRPSRGQGICLLIAAVLLFASGLLQTLARWQFLDRYGEIESAFYFSDAYQGYLRLAIYEVITAVLLIVFFAILLSIIFGRARTYLEVRYESAGAEDVSRRATAKLHRGFARRAVLAFVFVVLSAWLQVADAFLCVYLPWFWWVVLAVSVGGVIAFASFLLAITEQFGLQVSAEALHKNAETAHTDLVTPNYKTEDLQDAEQPKPESKPEQSESE